MRKYLPSAALMAQFDEIQIVLNNMTADLEAAKKGNKQACKRLRCMTRQFWKITKPMRELSIKEQTPCNS